MTYVKKKKRAFISGLSAIVLVACTACLFIPDVFAASSKTVDVGSLRISPNRVTAGKHPDITAQVGVAPHGKAKSLFVNIVAVITDPDHRIKSWNWKETITPESPLLITIPPEGYGTEVSGVYRVQIVVYSHDMKRQYASQSSTFEVMARERKNRQELETRESVEHEKIFTGKQQAYVGIGIYGNAMNPAGGGTILLWPFKYAGMQGLYSTGTFDSYEGRLLFKYDVSPRYSIYGGMGYLHVAADKNVLGVTTRFEDGAVSGVVGVEMTITKKVLLSIESSASRINLERVVISGGQTVTASVKYAPVTVGCSLVWMVF